MIKVLCILFLLLWVGCQTVSGQALFHFTVIDAQSREPLEGATVISSTGKSCITDKLGSFSMSVPADSAILTVSCTGYKCNCIMLKGGSIKGGVIGLEKGQVSLKEISIQNHSFSHKFNPLSELDLNRNPAKSAQDLLRLVPGLFIAQHQGGGKAEQIFLRGFDADHGTDVNISVDGMPVNMVSHAHGQGYADLHFVIPETIAGYDFGKGPYYTDRGDLCTAGYVAYSTSSTLDKDVLKLEGGQYATARVLGMMNILQNAGANKGTDLYAAVDGLYSNGGPFITPEHFHRLNVFSKLTQHFSDRDCFTLEASYMATKWEASGEIPNRAVSEGYVPNRFGSIDPYQGGTSYRATVIAKWTSSLASDFHLENEVYYTNYYFDLVNNFTFYYVDTTHGDEFNQHEHRNLYGYGGKLSKTYAWGSSGGSGGSGGARLYSTLGWGERYDQTDPTWLTHTEKAQFLNWLQLGQVRESNTNAYLDETLETGKWLFNAGLRADFLYFYYHNTAPESDTAANIYEGLPTSHTQGILSPKLNIQYTLNQHFQFYLKTGKGFHSNDVRVVVANDGKNTLPPAYGADLGVTWKPMPGLWINSALWYLFLRSEFTYGQDFGDLGVEPSGRTVRKGVDFSVRYEINKWLYANANVNVDKPRCIDSPVGHQYLALAPTFTSTAALDYHFANGINGGLSYRYLHDRSANSTYSLNALGYWITDLTCNYTRKKYEIGMSVENLFNQVWNESQYEYVSRLKYEKAPVDEVSYTPGDPFYLKLKLTFFF